MSGRATRIRCRAVLLDAGGVIVLPHRDLVSAALAEHGIEVEPSRVSPAHYAAVHRLDRCARGPESPGYLDAFCQSLGVPEEGLQTGVAALLRLADRERSGQVLWSEAVPHARKTIERLTRAGIRVVVVTNSDGHAAENLRDAGICQTAAGEGARVVDVIDSALVGAAKPDPAIFLTALQRAGAEPSSAVHVGDMASVDVVGARAAGITPIHLDPARRCRASDHRHISSLNGIWHHVAGSPRRVHADGETRPTGR